jgi:hypothetical protein
MKAAHLAMGGRDVLRSVVLRCIVKRRAVPYREGMSRGVANRKAPFVSAELAHASDDASELIEVRRKWARGNNCRTRRNCPDASDRVLNIER